MTKKILYLMMIIISCLSMISCEKKENANNDNDLFSGARYIKTSKAIIGDIENVLSYSGYIEYDEVIDITPKISGKIEKIFVKEGDYVKQNQLLAKIDKNSLEQFQANFNFADKNFKRAQSLYNEKAIDLKTFEEIETQWINAKTNFDFAKENLEVKAPFAGIITNVSMKVNENYDSMLNATGLFRIIGYGEVSTEVFVSDNDIKLIEINQLAKIKANDKHYEGVIEYVSPENDKLSGLNKIKIKVNNQHNELRNNQFVLVELIPQFKRNVIIVPRDALINENTIITVKNNRSLYKKIQTGMTDRHNVEVISGLKAGEDVIIEGNSGLDDNYPVTEFSN
ncbi:MAG: efflux RND transporter periplasmic adaptor subunit [Endomicrobiaceae bacterium]|nr:efflux RND transporter periplasmic adaptor subunit [Candidatus Cloacimonadota bacterium]